jgi:hypothetical protein
MSSEIVATDPALYDVRSCFGPAGGPDQVVLSPEGEALAFRLGTGLSRRCAAALLALSSDPTGLLCTKAGSRFSPTDLCRRFSALDWTPLARLGLVESFFSAAGDGVRLTLAGRDAVQRGREEQARLLERCRHAAGQVRA